MSLSTFTLAQVVMDLEPGYKMLRQLPHWHGPSHTLVGAAALAGVTVAVALPVVWLFDRLGGRRGLRFHLPLRAALCGALLGTFSHVALDAVMHADVFPFWPLGRANPLRGLLSVPALYDLCFWSAAVGGVAWGVLAAARRRRAARPALA